MDLSSSATQPATRPDGAFRSPSAHNRVIRWSSVSVAGRALWGREGGGTDLDGSAGSRSPALPSVGLERRPCVSPCARFPSSSAVHVQCDTPGVGGGEPTGPAVPPPRVGACACHRGGLPQGVGGCKAPTPTDSVPAIPLQPPTHCGQTFIRPPPPRTLFFSVPPPSLPSQSLSPLFPPSPP